MTDTPCLFCGGDASSTDHLLHCDGRQGQPEAFAVNSTYRAILDAPLGEHLREVAITRVDKGSPEEFREYALLAVWNIAQKRDELTSDDVWVALGEGGQWHTEKRALGPVMRTASTTYKWIAPTDRFVLTAQPLRHRAPIRVWRSLIHG